MVGTLYVASVQEMNKVGNFLFPKPWKLSSLPSIVSKTEMGSELLVDVHEQFSFQTEGSAYINC